MFEQATRQKIRFDSPQGPLSVEDLWDLPLTSTKRANLDDIARGLYLQLKSGADVSFVNTDKKSDPTIQFKFDLVKHIIDVRLAENAAASQEAAAKERKRKLLDVLEQVESKDLLSKSPEEIRAMIAAL